MSRSICLVNQFGDADSCAESTTGCPETCTLRWIDEVRWTTKQVLTACLWSALLGLACGYGWLLAQTGCLMCQ